VRYPYSKTWLTRSTSTPNTSRISFEFKYLSVVEIGEKFLLVLYGFLGKASLRHDGTRSGEGVAVPAVLKDFDISMIKQFLRSLAIAMSFLHTTRVKFARKRMSTKLVPLERLLLD
jgi:hypothetical protein